jgi:hypothetical protein
MACLVLCLIVLAFASAVTGGVVGFASADPLGALVFAAISNYVSKKGNSAPCPSSSVSPSRV